MKKIFRYFVNIILFIVLTIFIVSCSGADSLSPYNNIEEKIVGTLFQELDGDECFMLQADGEFHKKNTFCDTLNHFGNWTISENNLEIEYFDNSLQITDTYVISYFNEDTIKFLIFDNESTQVQLIYTKAAEIIRSCTDSSAYNFNNLANCDDNSCCFVAGCTQELAYNFNPSACFDDGSCEGVVIGCTSPCAINYNPDANVNDGSCEYFTVGCTDEMAYNYNPNANITIENLDSLQNTPFFNCNSGYLLHIQDLVNNSNADLTCDYTGVSVPDNNFEQYLIDIGLDYVLDGYISVNFPHYPAQYLNFNVENLNINSLIGIEAFTGIKTLNCSNNQLTSIDVSGLENLETLNCSNNQLTNIDVSGLENLKTLYCSDNQLNSLDLSNNPNLINLFASNNQIESISFIEVPINNFSLCFLNNNFLLNLDISSFNNFGELYIINNPNLNCIQTIDGIVPMPNYSQYDSHHYFSVNCP